jgi:hypothetical protein
VTLFKNFHTWTLRMQNISFSLEQYPRKYGYHNGNTRNFGTVYPTACTTQLLYTDTDDAVTWLLQNPAYSATHQLRNSDRRFSTVNFPCSTTNGVLAHVRKILFVFFCPPAWLKCASATKVTRTFLNDTAKNQCFVFKHFITFLLNKT